MIPIVTVNDWNDLQAGLSLRKKNSPRNLKKEYLLRGLLTCTECGIEMRPRAKHKTYTRADGSIVHYRPVLYYQCHRTKHTDGRRCSVKNYHRAPDLDAAVWDQIKQILLDPSTVTKLRHAANAPLEVEPSASDLVGEMARVREQAAALEAEDRRLVQLVVKGLLSEADFKNERERIATENTRLKKLIRKIEAQELAQRKREVGMPPIELEKLSARFAGRLDQLAFKERRLVTELIMQRAHVSPDSKLRISLKAIQLDP
jgi:site-specific DNA recombinase